MNFLHAVLFQRTHWQIWTLNIQTLTSQAKRETFQGRMKCSLYCDCHYSSLATDETQEYKERGVWWWLRTHLPVDFALLQVMCSPSLGFTLLPLYPTCWSQFPSAPLFPISFLRFLYFHAPLVPRHSSQTNSPSMISEEDALKKKKQTGKQSPWT